MATRWQQLGAFVMEIESLTDARLDRFAQIGGRWIVPVLAQLGYPDDHDPQCQRNLAALPALKERCAPRGIAVGGWFNGWAGGELHTTPAQDAEHVSMIVKGYNLGPVILDLEEAYKLKPWALPTLTWEVRQRITTRSIGVSTNEPNDSMIWNGGGLGYKASMQNLWIRLLPQWYPWMGTWGDPYATMRFLKDHGMEDNFHDPTGPAGRAIPLSTVKGTLEVTGMEGSELPPQLERLFVTKQNVYYDKGLSLYVLEQAPDSDLDAVEKYRGVLYAV